MCSITWGPSADPQILVDGIDDGPILGVHRRARFLASLLWFWKFPAPHRPGQATQRFGRGRPLAIDQSAFAAGSGNDAPVLGMGMFAMFVGHTACCSFVRDQDARTRTR